MTATRIEFHAVVRALPATHSVSHNGPRAITYHGQGLNVLVIQSGIGPVKARISTQQLVDAQSWDVLISAGFAGGVDDTAPIGSLVIGQEVFETSSSPHSLPSQPIMCHSDWVKTALTIPWHGHGVLRTGKFTCVDRVLIHSAEKYSVGIRSGAVAVDMESAAIGQIAQGHDLPFLIVRAISDGVNDDLPVDFNLFLAPSGWVAGVARILSTPKSWKGFLNVYRHSKQASRQLTIFFEAFFSTVSTMPESSASLLNRS